MHEKPDRGGLTAGGAIFSHLKKLGVDYVFANSGTDFPPIIEGLAMAAHAGIEIPKAMTIPHEHAALGMAHGHYFMSGKAQAVILHTNVGLANGTIGALNAATDNVPVILMSGRTPTVEKGRFGARTVPIGWGQEMLDQTSLVREACKWDYELRFPEQVPEMLDRACAIARSTPKGPVYLSLPREVLSQPLDTPADMPAQTMAPALSEPPAQAIIQAAEWLSAARHPVIFVQRGAGNQQGFEALTALAETHAIPVVHYWATQIGVPTDHPMYAGGDPARWLEDADVILAVDALAPWSPDIHTPNSDARIIQFGPDPLFSRTPVRNFRSDLSIATETGPGLEALARALDAIGPSADARPRHERIAQVTAGIREAALAEAEAGEGPVMTKAYVSLRLSEAIRDHDATILSELGCPLAPMTLKNAQSWYQEPFSGGLGWSLPAALGMKLARPDKLIVATMGDGSYMFSNPVACHQISQAYGIAVLVVIVNNAEWGAVRQSVTAMYPDGYAARANEMPLTALKPSPKFELVAEACDAWAKSVTSAAELEPALKAAIEEVTRHGRTALLNVHVC